jgi:hypothetical protein
MASNLNRFGKIFAALTAAVAWTGLIAQSYVSYYSDSADLSAPAFILKILSFISMLSNAAVAVCLTSQLLFPSTAIGKFFSRPAVNTAIAVYIAILGLANAVQLGNNGWSPQGLEKFAHIILHFVLPVLYVTYWLVFVPKGTLNWKNPFYWLVYPIVYTVYILIRGSVTNDYPYEFTDVNRVGYGAVLIHSLGMCIAVFVVGEAFVGIDKLLGRAAGSGAS